MKSKIMLLKYVHCGLVIKNVKFEKDVKRNSKFKKLKLFLIEKHLLFSSNKFLKT